MYVVLLGSQLNWASRKEINDSVQPQLDPRIQLLLITVSKVAF